MAASGAPVRQLRRGPAPIASFDHDVSDEVRPSSPETKQTFRLPEIREDPVSSSSLAPPEQRPRSHSSPAVAATGALGTPAAPRIDISRASSSSHHDSRDSSPELALFAGAGEDSRTRLELGFREDGALELRSSTEELAFLEGAPGEPRPSAPPPPSISRRHSRKDSQGSEAALLAVSGRTSRLSSVGSQCSAHSALSAFSHASRISRLSVVSGVSRSPSPHRMLLETSFCGPKPIETDPEICAAAVEERLLEIAKLSANSPPDSVPAPVDARDRREVRTEAMVERASRPPPPSPLPTPAIVPPLPVVPSTPVAIPTPDEPATTVVVPAAPPVDDKLQKENQNRARAQERRARPRVRREPSEPEVYKSGNRTKDIIRIKLKPDEDYDDTEYDITSQEPTVTENEETTRKPASLELAVLSDRAVRPTELVGRSEPAPLSPVIRNRAPRDSRTPSPAGAPVSRKSSFCSLFKSRETIASPDSPSDALRRKRSLTEGRSRSKSRDRSATPSSSGKIRGSVLSLFKTSRKSATSPSPSSREGSPVVHQQRAISVVSQSVASQRPGEKLKYYDDTRDGIIHIPLRTPPDEQPGSSSTRRDQEPQHATVEAPVTRETQRPASAPHTRAPLDRDVALPSSTQKPVHRTVLPDGSIIIPLRSPTESTFDPPPMSPLGSTAISAVHRAAEVESEGHSPSTAAAASAGIVSSTSTHPFDCTPEAAPNLEHTETAPTVDDGRRRRKERIIFTTHVGSREQVFSTQFSITKTPSVTSEISGSFPSFVDPDETRGPATRDSAVVEGVPPESEKNEGTAAALDTTAATPPSPQEVVRDSSESEPSSESAPPRGGNDVERRGLVVQESFEEELPYVPTTLPQERSVALPMVPVRERAGVLLAALERPRATMPAPPPPATAAHAPRVARPAPSSPAAGSAPAPPERLRIRLPRRTRTASVASVTVTPTPRTDRVRTRSGGDDLRPKTEWIDFEEVPERRKQPKRIQTLPAAAASGASAGVVFSYVEPEHCRCECHAHSRDDELPLLQDDQLPHTSSSSLECGEASVQLNVEIARPFTADLDLHPDAHIDEERRPH